MRPTRRCLALVAAAWLASTAVFVAAEVDAQRPPVEERDVRVDSPWGVQRVHVLLPNGPRGAATSQVRRWPMVVALHGMGEARRGMERGPLGWSLDYRIGDAFAALARGRLGAEDYRGFVRASDLRGRNRALRARPFEGLIVACPYTPPMMDDRPGSDAIVAWGTWVAGPMLAALRRAIPEAAAERASTGIDGVSLGGMLALEVGLRHPEAFATVGAIQPAVRGRDGEIGRLGSPDANQRIRLLTSERDPFLIATRALSERWRGRNLDHELVVLPGPHDYTFNRGPGGLELLYFHDRNLWAHPSGRP